MSTSTSKVEALREELEGMRFDVDTEEVDTEIQVTFKHLRLPPESVDRLLHTIATFLEGFELRDAIWEAIKGWDIQRKDGEGYAGATGTDVDTIVQAVALHQVVTALRGGE